VLIDGSTQPSFTSAPVIEIRGDRAGAGADGLDVLAGSSTIKDLAIDRFRGSGVVFEASDGDTLGGCDVGFDPSSAKGAGNGVDGVLVSAGGNTLQDNTIGQNGLDGVHIEGAGASRNVLQGNWVGVAPSGAGNSNDGVFIASPSNTVGGTGAGAGNTLSGNAVDGIHIAGSAASGNQILGNTIGTDASGTADLGNGVSGVVILGAPGNTVGGSAPGEGNLIVTNENAGILIAGGVDQVSGAVASTEALSVTGNSVVGNLVGVGPDGRTALGNDNQGVLLFRASGVTIGAGNVISANGSSGIAILDPASTANLIEGNFVGTDATGTLAVHNAHDGVLVDAGSRNTIGGLGTGAGNVLSGNAGNGVYLTDGATGNQVLGNTVGLALNGTNALGNGLTGVELDSGGNSVGGSTAAARNVISSNGSDGLELVGAASTSNVIQGNRIGTDASGTLTRGNARDGIFLQNAGANTIGGAAAGQGNQISGNGSSGLRLGGAAGNLVLGNLIGTSADGESALGNRNDGITLQDSAANTLGALAGQGGNVISGNGADGILIGGPASRGNQVQANEVGTDRIGASALANRADGIGIVGASGTTIGGYAADARNVLSGNGQGGVHIVSVPAPAVDPTLIQGNAIGTDASGERAVANASGGILVEASPGILIVGNTVSGNATVGIQLSGTASQRNLIQGNSVGTDALGTTALSNGVGIFLDGAPGNLLLGNQISGNASAGVAIGSAGASSNVVQANLIGLDASGTHALGNAFGVFLQGAGANTIGGVAPGVGNTISGNASAGIEITDSGATGNVVAENLIGTNSSGSAAILRSGTTSTTQHQNVGVLIVNNAAGNQIGVSGAGNVISGNVAGINVANVNGGAGNVLQSNLVGTDATGSHAIGNVDGIYLNAAANNLIGGTAPGAGNIVAANTAFGIVIFGSQSSQNVLEGNLVGVLADGRTTFRGPDGVFVQPVGIGIQDAPNNVVGGPASGAGNVVTGNQTAGIYLYGTGNQTTGNQVLANLVGLNADGTNGAGNGQYGILERGAAGNTAPLTGAEANRFGTAGFATFRELPTGLATTARVRHASHATPRGPKHRHS
jgi:parallel beta-helix repeat protein